MAAHQPPMSWPVIIAIMVAAIVGTGLLVGLLGRLVPLPPWLPNAAVGAAGGLAAALLITRRNAALRGPPPR